MARIDPTNYIVDWDPQDERVLSVASWYSEENITVDVEQWVGRHTGDNVHLGVETINWFLAQGWYIVATTRIQNQGHWLTYSSAGNYAGAVTNYWSTVSRVALRRIRINPKTVLQDMVSEFTKAYNEGRKLNDSRYDELVKLYAAMVNDTQDQLATFDYSEADYRPLINQLLDGITGVADRYDDSIDGRIAAMDAIPGAFKDESDSALLRISGVPTRFRSDTEHTPPVVHRLSKVYHDDADTATGELEAVPASFGDETATISSNYGQGKLDEINRRFDALISQKKSDLVSRGLYNSTVYDSAIADLERQRAVALSEASENIGTFLLNVAKAKADQRQAAATAKLQVAAQAGNFLLSGEKVEVEVAEIAAKLESATGTSELSAASTKAQVGLNVGTAALEALAKGVGVRSTIANAILGVIERMIAVKSQLTTPLKLRNEAFLSMLSFMERRTDDYPGLDQLLQVTTQLGYGNGATLYPSSR